MNLKAFGPGNWLDFARVTLVLLILIGGGLTLGGDFRWLTITAHEAADVIINQKIIVAAAEQTKALNAIARKLASNRISDLDSRITFLQIKVRQGEASKSEEIILPILERRLRELISAAER